VAKTTTAELMAEWVQVAAQAIVHSGELTISPNYSNLLFVQAGLDSTTAHTGTKFIVELSNAASGDEDWHELFSVILCIGTAATEAFAATEPATETVIAAASTTGFVTNGVWLFVKDNSIAASELVRQIAYVTDTSITILDGLTNEHTAADALWNIADSRVWLIPTDALRVRLVVDNNYDSGASTICYRAWLGKTTAL